MNKISQRINTKCEQFQCDYSNRMEFWINTIIDADSIPPSEHRFYFTRLH
jgi:hypothetical protein